MSLKPFFNIQWLNFTLNHCFFSNCETVFVRRIDFYSDHFAKFLLLSSNDAAKLLLRLKFVRINKYLTILVNKFEYTTYQIIITKFNTEFRTCIFLDRNRTVCRRINCWSPDKSPSRSEARTFEGERMHYFCCFFFSKVLYGRFLIKALFSSIILFLPPGFIPMYCLSW